jgi:hypothetical protein
MIVGTMKDEKLKLRNLRIETRLIDEMFASVMGEYVFLK